mmetsp:Transcript_22703/g.33857  ORF Transcript_22703/g.33857 Transcript_22703/m.33857 type:complete len:360 (+) Transcript_22703:36-1115(+)
MTEGSSYCPKRIVSSVASRCNLTAQLVSLSCLLGMFLVLQFVETLSAIDPHDEMFQSIAASVHSLSRQSRQNASHRSVSIIDYGNNSVSDQKSDKLSQEILPNSVGNGITKDRNGTNFTGNEVSGKRQSVAVLMVGFPNYFLWNQTQELMIKYLLGPLRRWSDTYAFLCTDTRMLKYINNETLKEMNISLFHSEVKGRLQYYRKAWCYEQVKKFASNNSISFTWLIQTRPDLVYFSEIPNPTLLEPNAIYARLRAAGSAFSARWKLESLHFSHAFTAPSHLGCWGALLDWQKDCIVSDDQFSFIPWSFTDKMMIPGMEWSGFRGKALKMEDRFVNPPFLDKNVSYAICEAAYPGETSPC